DDLNTGKNVIDQSGLTGNIWTSTVALVSGHQFRWYVMGLSNGGARVWSNPQTFTVNALAPTLIAPVGNASGTLPTFSWNTVAWADHYEVWVDDLTIPKTKVIDQTGLTGNSWTSTVALTSSHQYRWWVKA